MKLSKFQAIYLAAILAITVFFFGINFQGTLSAYVNLEVAIYILTINSLAVMAFFYLGNTEYFKKNNLKGLKKAYKKEAAWHFVFASVTAISIYILQYVIQFNIYCPPGAAGCVLASTQYSVLTWLAITGLVFGGVMVCFILVAISFILAIYVPISIILKKEPKKEVLRK